MGTYLGYGPGPMIVYLLTNRLNGKQYVGQTVNSLKYRLQRHGWASSSKHMPISAAMQKYGKENFTAEILCECTSQIELNEKEKFWATKLSTFAPNGYNLFAGDGYGSASPEMKRLISEGRKRGGYRHSDETKKRMSKAHTGIKVSPEANKKRSEAMKGRKPSYLVKRGKTCCFIDPLGQEVTFTNIGAFSKAHGLSISSMQLVAKGLRYSHKGWRLPGSQVPAFASKKHSNATKAKISASKKGHAVSVETRSKLRAANVGKRLSQETKDKIQVASKANGPRLGAARKGQKASPETCAKISVAVKASWEREHASGQSERGKFRGTYMTYTFLDPTGQVVTITDLKSFCAQHDLGVSKMCAVAKGHRASHKGWRLAA